MEISCAFVGCGQQFSGEKFPEGWTEFGGTKDISDFWCPSHSPTYETPSEKDVNVLALACNAVKLELIAAENDMLALAKKTAILRMKYEHAYLVYRREVGRFFATKPSATDPQEAQGNGAK
jgi:hypothetical protein